MIFRLKKISKDLTKHIEDAGAIEMPSTTALSSSVSNNTGKFKNNKLLNFPVGKRNAVAPDITITNNVTGNVVTVVKKDLKKDEDSKVSESIREERVVSKRENSTGSKTFQNLLSIVKISGVKLFLLLDYTF